MQTATGKTSRLFFIDHLRASLVALVVLHHVALVYGAGAPFYYVEPPINDPLSFLVLLVFILVNQCWFMGAFFLFSGYFTPGSFDRKELVSTCVNHRNVLSLLVKVSHHEGGKYAVHRNRNHTVW